MVHFKTIYWKNFLSYGNYVTEVSLDSWHTNILLGDSGSGKSTLLDAVSFALFNKPFRGITKPQLVNSLNEKNCYVEVSFQIGKKEYRVGRGIKPNIFEIYENDKLINQDASNRDYQQYLETQILGFNYKSFCQIVVLGAANFVPFMQLKPRDRRVIIEELLDIEIFGVMNGLLRERISGIKQSITDTEVKMDILREKKTLHENYIKTLLQNRENKIAEKETKIEDNNTNILDLRKRIKELDENVKLHKQHLEAEKTISAQIIKVKDLESRLSESLKNVNRQIDFFESNDQCPTCMQQIKPKLKKNEIKRKQLKVEEIETGLTQVEKKIKRFEKKKTKIEKVRDKINSINREIARHKSSIYAMEKYIQEVDKEIQELKKPKKNIAAEKKLIKKVNQELSEYQDDIQKLANDRATHDMTSMLLKDGGIKAKIIRQYLPLINKNTNKFLSAMNFFASFYMNENFHEYIKSRGHDDFSYESFSEGEKQRIDLALLFTWRSIAKLKNSVSTNLLILDEVFDSYLDVEATENVLELLNGSLFKDSNIFVISHKNTIADKFDHRIRCKKVKNFSKIEED